MPIIEPTSGDVPLSQGDILNGVPLIKTEATDTGFGSVRSKARLSMVLSRPCNLQHKENVIVAEIHQYSESVPRSVETLDEALDFLTDLRDGISSPDRFYLGEIPMESGRFVAMLDSAYTINATDKRSLLAYRVASLNDAFQRDLHVRLLTAFASLGFDDVDWVPTSDLELLKSIGDGQLAKLRQAEKEQLALEAKQQFGCNQFSTRTLDKVQEEVGELKAKMRPYIELLAKRKGR